MTDLISERDAAQKEAARFYATLSAARPVRHLNQKELARRWSMSPKTLERWRWLGEGPPYLKIGGKVLYRLEDIEAYEAIAKQAPTKHLPPSAGLPLRSNSQRGVEA